MKPVNKKILLLAAMVAVALSASAQHYIGVYGGYGGGAYRPEPKRETGMLIGYPRAAVSWKYYSPQRIVGGIGADLMYVKKGYKVWPRVDSDTTYQRTVESIELPVMWQPHLYMFNRRIRAFLNLGVYVSYNMASDTMTVSAQNGTLWEGKYPLRIVKDNILGYGLTAGGGLGVFFDRFEVFVEARYSFGYSDLLKYPRKYPGNPQRSPVDHFGISLGVYYRLGKGGILAPPAKRRPRPVPVDVPVGTGPENIQERDTIAVPELELPPVPEPEQETAAEPEPEAAVEHAPAPEAETPLEQNHVSEPVPEPTPEPEQTEIAD